MAVLAFRTFLGEIPKAAAWQLPDGAAQFSSLCDHSQGFLAPVKDGLFLKTLSNAGGTIKGLYTEDGINFFTWTSETQAFKGPIATDSFNRVYYLTPSEGVFRVTTVPDSAYFNGGSPITNYKAGVPKPTTAPVLSVVDRTTLLDYPAAVFTFQAWWEYNGTEYDRGAVSATISIPYKRFTITVPAKGASTPPDSKLVVQATLAEGTKQLFTIDSAEGAEVAGRTSALPGGVEMSIEIAGTVCVINFLWGVIATYAYVYTAVNLWSEESQPSPIALISPTYMQDVQIVVNSPTFTGYRPFSDFNIYRTFGNSPNYVRITKAALVTIFTYKDVTSGTGDIGPALRSTDWAEPPTGLQGLELSSEGWFLAFKGNTLYMSEPNRPHAWPYFKAFPRNIRGIRVGKRFAVVTTADASYVVVGVSPASVSVDKLEVPQAGISQRTMVNVDGAVAFASNDGIVSVTGGQASMELSRRYFDRADWRTRYGVALATTGFRFAYHDGALLAFSDSGARPGFYVRLDQEDSTFTELPVAIDSAFYLSVADALYYVVGNSIYEYGAGSAYLGLGQWTSKEYRLPKHESFSVVYVRKGAGTMTLEILRDGGLLAALVSSASLGSGAAGEYVVRLPSDKRSDRWAVRALVNCEVYDIQVAGDPKELKNV